MDRTIGNGFKKVCLPMNGMQYEGLCLEGRKGVGSEQIYIILYTTKLPECDAGTAQENHLHL